MCALNIRLAHPWSVSVRWHWSHPWCQSNRTLLLYKAGIYVCGFDVVLLYMSVYVWVIFNIQYFFILLKLRFEYVPFDSSNSELVVSNVGDFFFFKVFYPFSFLIVKKLTVS